MVKTPTTFTFLKILHLSLVNLWLSEIKWCEAAAFVQVWTVLTRFHKILNQSSAFSALVLATKGCSRDYLCDSFIKHTTAIATAGSVYCDMLNFYDVGYKSYWVNNFKHPAEFQITWAHTLRFFLPMPKQMFYRVGSHAKILRRTEPIYGFVYFVCGFYSEQTKRAN